MKKLHLGCGKDYKQGFVNLDINKNLKADVYSDLEKPLPFEDNSFDFVLADRVLEHLNTPLALIEEIWRVLKPKGVFTFECPYGCHINRFHMVHKSFLSPKSFDMFLDSTQRVKSWDFESKARFRKDFFKVRFMMLPRWLWFPECFQYVNIFVDVVADFKGRFIAIK